MGSPGLHQMSIAIRRWKSRSRCQRKTISENNLFLSSCNQFLIVPKCGFGLAQTCLSNAQSCWEVMKHLFDASLQMNGIFRKSRFLETWDYCSILFKYGFWARPHVGLVCLLKIRHWNSFFMDPRPCIESKSCRLVLHTWLCSSIYDLCTSICMYSNSCQKVKLDKLSKLS